jgi:hypothetical protein
MSGSNVVSIRWATTDPNGGERNWEGVNNVDAQGALSFRVGTSQTADPTTTRLAIMPQGAVILSGGSYTTSGIGITFPASQSASGDANTLDDYEEGTFTPTWSGANSGSGTRGSGSYIKIGRFVTVTIVMNDVTFITFSGTLFCSLPFTAGSPGGGAQYTAGPMYYYTGGNWNTGSTTAGITPNPNDGDSTMVFTYMLVNGDRQSAVGSSSCTLSGASSTYARFSVSYFTSS